MDASMQVTLSSKYQIAIPAQVRRALKLKPGQKLRVMVHAGRIELVLVADVKTLKGFLSGMNTDFDRDVDRL